MPHLVKLYIRQVIIGYLVAAAFVGMLMVFNVANLWSLVSGSPVGWLALLMLWLFNGVVFAGVQFALALPRGTEDDDNKGRRAPMPVTLSQAIPVRAQDRREG